MRLAFLRVSTEGQRDPAVTVLALIAMVLPVRFVGWGLALIAGQPGAAVKSMGGGRH